MKILLLGKKKLFGLKRSLGLLRNDMDVEALTAGLQPRDGACTQDRDRSSPWHPLQWRGDRRPLG